MLYTIKNDKITVQIASDGAELMSIKSADGTEYLWQGDSTYWGGRAYNLFPICGRITDGKYKYKGEVIEGLKSPHGYVRKSAADEVVEIADDQIKFLFKSSDATKKFYPFDFVYSLTYTLFGGEIKMSIDVVNNGNEDMYFAVGGHPGFNVPLADGKFEDYYLEFEDGKNAKTIYMSDTCFITDRVDEFKLEGDKLPLVHSLFDRDAIVLTDIAKSITLKGTKTDKSIKVSFPKEMKYVGLWHAPKTEAPFVAIEPWTGLPSYDGVIDDLETKRDMFRLASGKAFNLVWSIEIK